MLPKDESRTIALAPGIARQEKGRDPEWIAAFSVRMECEVIS